MQETQAGIVSMPFLEACQRCRSDAIIARQRIADAKGWQQAAELIDTGAAHDRLERFVTASQSA